ncbi:unknown [Roseburia sp. CAG:380]|nr:unknown [Roseburia sp. CAG:380]
MAHIPRQSRKKLSHLFHLPCQHAPVLRKLVLKTHHRPCHPKPLIGFHQKPVRMNTFLHKLRRHLVDPKHPLLLHLHQMRHDLRTVDRNLSHTTLSVAAFIAHLLCHFLHQQTHIPAVYALFLHTLLLQHMGQLPEGIGKILQLVFHRMIRIPLFLRAVQVQRKTQTAQQLVRQQCQKHTVNDHCLDNAKPKHFTVQCDPDSKGAAKVCRQTPHLPLVTENCCRHTKQTQASYDPHIRPCHCQQDPACCSRHGSDTDPILIARKRNYQKYRQLRQ